MPAVPPCGPCQKPQDRARGKTSLPGVHDFSGVLKLRRFRHNFVRRHPRWLAPVAGVASQIIRHRALEYKWVDPADPMYMETRDEDSGDLVHTYTSLTMATVLSITDEDLVQLMYQILQIFPTFGCCMIDGHLRQLGHTSPHLALTSCTITFMAPQFPIQTIL
ncbi:hypothetical protein DFH07DRAFT_779942 [Mycena maculata]|uniref:Uncharacterized protein n=1 Tax=Mycena maculata TaxID=230809 RepID=A0AAD7MWS5_9AGAR|nr:hypothetical protein DFH07DRAFT_779942 [Mycena maculata]